MKTVFLISIKQGLMNVHNNYKIQDNMSNLKKTSIKTKIQKD